GYYRAYADGVNAYLDDKSPTEVSLEYAVLGLQSGETEIEKWTPVDSVSWLKAMAWDLRSNLEDEIDRAILTSELDEEQVADLFPDYPYDTRPTILGGIAGHEAATSRGDAAEDPGAGEGPGGQVAQPGRTGQPGEQPDDDAQTHAEPRGTRRERGRDEPRRCRRRSRGRRRPGRTGRSARAERSARWADGRRGRDRRRGPGRRGGHRCVEPGRGPHRSQDQGGLAAGP